MSGWIKLEKDLLTDPRLLAAASQLGQSYAFRERNGDALRDSNASNAQMFPGVTLMLGALARLWVIADTHIGDDDVLALTVDQIDELVGLRGFCNVLPSEWLEVLDGKRVKLPNYHEHNGSVERQRANNAKRQQNYRTRNALRNASNALPRNAVRNDQPLPDKTKTRQEKNTDPPSPLVAGLDGSAWERWVQYRSQIKKPIRPASTQAAQMALAAYGHRQAAVVEQSIANGWQGLFELKISGNGNGHSTSEASTAYEELLSSDGAKRNERVQRALEAIGGWQRVRMRTPREDSQVRREFCAAYDGRAP